MARRTRIDLPNTTREPIPVKFQDSGVDLITGLEYAITRTMEDSGSAWTPVYVTSTGVPCILVDTLAEGEWHVHLRCTIGAMRPERYAGKITLF